MAKLLKPLIILIVGVALSGAAYLYGTSSAKTVIEAPERSWGSADPLAEAWQNLSVSLEAAGEKVHAAARNEQERTEGMAFLSQLLSAAIEMKFTKGDPAQPAFTDWMASGRKYLGDSPDADYHTAEISADYDYEITGERGQALSLGFVIYGRAANGWNTVSASLNGDEIQYDADGRFRLRLTASAPSGGSANTMAMPKSAHLIMVRAYYYDRAQSKRAQVKIGAIGDTIPSRTPSEKLANATEFFNGAVAGTIAMFDLVHTRPNTNTPPRGYSPAFEGLFYPTPDNQYLGTWYKIAKDEALVIEGAVPDARYWSVSLQNRWLQSHDYERRAVSLNNSQIETKDGRYRLIVSAQQPKSGNWLDTSGREEGLVAIRYQRTTKSDPPEITLVKFADLAR